MRKISAAIIAASLCAGPAFAVQKLGERTATPDQILAELGDGVSDEELARAVAAASAFPLGSVENPVRVGGPEGERSYLARLTCSDGKRPSVGERSAAGVGAFGSIVGAYALDCGAASPGKFRIVMDMYHEGYSEARAPAGFAIDPL